MNMNLQLPICPKCKDTSKVTKKITLREGDPAYRCTRCNIVWGGSTIRYDIPDGFVSYSKEPSDSAEWVSWDGQPPYPEFIMDEGKIYTHSDFLKKKAISRYNFKIKFLNSTWVVKQTGGGLNGHYKNQATKIGSESFGVLSITKMATYSNIHVWSDGTYDGQNCFLVNVPNELFEVIDENHNPSV